MLRLASSILAVWLIAALACTQGGGAEPAATYRPSAPDRPGGTAVLTDFEQPQALHPLAARTDVELRVGTLLFSPLWAIGPGLQPIPELVRDVPTPDNGGVRTARDGRSMSVDVRLAPGRRWSDGRP